MGLATGRIAFILATGIALMMGSCASIVSQSHYTVPIRSEPSGAMYTIKDRKGRLVKQGTTPAMVQLKPSNGYFKRAIYRVDLSMEGREPSSAVLRAQLNNWYWGNILIGGFLGMLVVDPLSGSMYRLDRGMVHELMPLSY
jgi:hypothetical protein